MSGLLVLQGGECRLGVRGGALLVEKGGEPVTVLRPEDVEAIQAWGDANISPAARRKLLWHGIEVTFLTRDGRVTGRMSGGEHKAGERRLAQLRAVLDAERRLAVAQRMVAGKLRNQHAVLSRIQRRERSDALADALVLIRAGSERAVHTDKLETLRGVEGYGARAYFSVLGAGLTNPLFRFERRTRRPPRDPVNAALSFLYTLLCERCGHAARAAGLDVYVGFLHDAGRGREALAFDLAEEWRPVVDSLVLGLFNRRQLAPEDFVDPAVDLSQVGAPEADDRGEDEQDADEDRGRAVYLGPVGRGVVLTAWSRRLRERVYHPGQQARFELREIIRLQAQALARVVEGRQDAYEPFRWRA
jgi:CRISPR-associated protein Cas1